MANNVSAAIVEEEPPHEIYANLLEKPGSCRSTGDRRNAAAAAVAGSPHSNFNGSRGNPGAILIPTDDYYPEPSSSQFINFYRKSCQTQLYSETDGVNKTPAHKSKRTKSAKNMRPHTTQSCSTTKSERRRMAKRERELQVQKDKRIRIMLRSDFSEVDEMLYRGLTR